MKRDLPNMTKSELIALLERRRSYQRSPKVQEANRARYRRIRDGYEAARKGGLV